MFIYDSVTRSTNVLENLETLIFLAECDPQRGKWPIKALCIDLGHLVKTHHRLVRLS